MDGLTSINPDYIAVTYGHGSQSDHTITANIAEMINRQYHIPVIAHLTALYSDEESVNEVLGLFRKAGVAGVLALRGDPVKGNTPCGVFRHASDLTAYIHRREPELKLFGACYPECHFEAASLEEDIDNLHKKIDAGVSRLVTQLFYDNDVFYRFSDLAKGRGIHVPVEAGIMPIRSAKSVRKMAEKNRTSIPKAVISMVDKWEDDSESLQQAGIVYASEQIADLVAHGVDGIHLYTMNRSQIARSIWANVEPLFTAAE